MPMSWIEELSEEPLTRYKQLREDPWLFLKYCIYTKDEVDIENPIKRYPSHFDYARFIVMMWQREKRIAIPKSRRMTVSWTCLALITHDIIFYKGRNWAVLSKKEEAARELVSRIEFMIKHIPDEIISKSLIPKMKRDGMQSSPPVIEFAETHSRVQGYPQGPNQLRQYGFSGIFEDECAFQEESEESYAAALPTIKGGGRFIKVSSRAVEDKGFFKKIVFDRLDAQDMRFPEIAPVKTKAPMEGVTVWKNPNNGFLVIDLHYTANPDKRDPEFRETLRRELPARRFAMEYEKSWMTYEGRPVYEDFSDIHLTKDPLHVDAHLPLLIGWDSSGLTPAALIAQLQNDQLVILKEIMGTDVANSVGATRFVPHVKSVIYTTFPQIMDVEKQTISFYDPAGRKKNEVTEETYVGRMMAEGFKRQRPGQQTFKARVDAVTDYLIGLVRGKPKIIISEIDCPLLVAGFRGGYRFSDKIADNEPNKPEALKDIHSHIQDALQYICTGLKGYKQEMGYSSIPTPQYSFQKHETSKRPQLRKKYG